MSKNASLFQSNSLDGEYDYSRERINPFIQTSEHDFENKLLDMIELGNSYINAQDNEKAIAVFTRAINQISSEIPNLFLERGLAYKNLGKNDKALNDYDEAINLCKKHLGLVDGAESVLALAYNRKGSVIIQKDGYTDQALDYFNKAIELNNKLVSAYFNRGVIYIIRENYPKAFFDFDKVIELNPQYGLAYNNRGAIYQHDGNHEAAEKDYKKAIEFNVKEAADNLKNLEKMPTEHREIIESILVANEIPIIDPSVDYWLITDFSQNTMKPGDIFLLYEGNEIKFGKLIHPEGNVSDAQIEWFLDGKSQALKELNDPYLSRIFINQTESPYLLINDYRDIINRNIYDIYYSDNSLHSIIRTVTCADFSLTELKLLTNFLSDSYMLLGECNLDGIKLRINVHSPLLMEVIVSYLPLLGIIGITGIIAMVYAFKIVPKYGGKIKYAFAEVETKGSIAEKTELNKSITEVNKSQVEILRQINVLANNPNIIESCKALKDLGITMADMPLALTDNNEDP